MFILYFFFFSSRRRHTRFKCDWSSDVCSSDLELGDRRRRRVDVEQHVMTLTVFVHAVGEIAQAPVFALLDFAALVGDQLGEGIGQLVDLGAGDILARDKHVFIKRHSFRPLWLMMTRSAGAGRVQPTQAKLPAAGKGSRAI